MSSLFYQTGKEISKVEVKQLYTFQKCLRAYITSISLPTAHLIKQRKRLSAHIIKSFLRNKQRSPKQIQKRITKVTEKIIHQAQKPLHLLQMENTQVGFTSIKIIQNYLQEYHSIINTQLQNIVLLNLVKVIVLHDQFVILASFNLGSEELNSLICHLQSENEQLQILLAEKDRNLKLLNQKLEKNEYESTHYTNENSELREAISNIVLLRFRHPKRNL